MGPGEEVEDDQIGCRIKEGLLSQGRLDEGKPHKAGIGIDAAKGAHPLVEGGIAPVVQGSGDGNVHQMVQQGQQQGKEKARQPLPVKGCLLYTSRCV